MSTGSPPKRGFSTQAVHAGEDRKKFGDSLTTPIVQTSTFVFHDAKDVHDYTSKAKFRFEYSRYGTPTQRTTEKKLAELDGAQDCLLFASGMSAVTTALLALLSKGQHLVITDDVYKKTLQFCQNDLPRFGIECAITPMGDYQALEKAIQPNTRILFSESPTNPYLNILDMKKFVAIGKKHRLTTIVDATFATPVNQQPLAFGVDIVIHSATKYLGGHNDLLAGAALGKERFVNEVRDFQKTTGGVIDPHCCYLLLRGLKTLFIRVARQNATALTV
ncbi:MAG: PLP-dependent transferase, partial [Planctomycetes bacterium]|nr:PLP-dependent transferase [Planctomycetota bacterium]